MNRLAHTAAGLSLALTLAVGVPVDLQGQAPEDGDGVELVVAAGVQDREPTGVSDSFAADVGRVYAWMQLTGYADQAIQVVWTHGENTFNVPLEIGGSPWRTWSSKTIPSDWSGPWSVSVEDAEGNVLASTDFTVGSAAP